MVIDVDTTLPEAEQTARDFLDCANEHIGEYALGSESYTLADTLLTCMLARLQVGNTFFEQEVKVKRPNVYAYFLRMQKRPSWQQTCTPAPLFLTTFKVTLILLVVSLILSSIVFGVTCIFKPVDWRVLGAIWGVVFLLILLFFTITGCNARRKLRAHLDSLNDNNFKRQ